MPSISSCPKCAAVVVPLESGGVCPQCHTPFPESEIGTVLPADLDDVTRLSDPPAETVRTPRTPLSDSRRGRSVRDSSASGWAGTTGAIDHGRFEPGTLLGGRYRIVERLGRGGMGEVYRADDLKLGQPVALKFLPADVDRDPARLTQLHTEVRMARQVSHPNVCRVYDIDEVEGQTFLSMEYVDGEDLASLLRRIGRFPEDRALEIARQICAGLAAAHERNVIHRDLKPANVMLDASGKVRLTDFGLAGLSGEALRAGTPAYMSPEQLAGAEVNAQSDIYSLGLVLYEVFTGQRALDGKNLAELINKREQSGIALPTAIVKSLDPKIETAIMRCLRPEPPARPASALAVAAALPGGDPLAAALAAGETPSPDMVAAAGSAEAFNALAGLSLVAVVITGLLAYGAVCDRYLLYARVPMQKTLDALEDRARDIVGALGYPTRTTDWARGLSVDTDYLGHVARTDKSPTRWDVLAQRDVPIMRLWYRSSPAALLPLAPQWGPSLNDPPQTTSGMTTATVDDQGRLVEFLAVLPRADGKPPSPAPAPPWPALFSAAGLSMDRFQPVEPEWIPRVFADSRAAWEGTPREGSQTRIRVEAGSYRGKPVFFRLVGPWTPRDQPAAQSDSTNSLVAFFRTAASALSLLLLLGTLALARHNLKAGRGDRRGAARTALFMIAVWLAAWALGARHFPSLDNEKNHFYAFVEAMLFNVGVIWLLYVAIEPYVRRFSPGILMSWTRLTSGQIVDARVGRDLLIGVTIGVAMALLGLSFPLVSRWLGDPPPTPRITNIAFLLGTRIAGGALLRMIPNALSNAMAVAILFVTGRALSRSVWGGAIFATVLLGVFVLSEGGSDRIALSVAYAVVFVGPLVVTLLYFGLLAEMTAFLVNQALNNTPLTLDFSQPYAGGAVWTLVLVVGVALFGYYASRAGQPLFGRLMQQTEGRA